MTIGQLILDKGLDVVIKALAKLPMESRPTLLVAGRDTQQQGRYQAELEALAKHMGVTEHIQWLGFLPEVSRLYEQVDAMVCPSRVEPLGLVPLEAARFALPTLAHDTGGFRETIRDGDTGWLVAREDVEAWARALSELQDQAEVQRRGQQAWQHTREHFSPEVYQTGLMRVYDGLVG
ncbi:MAG: glycosyltransferase [Phycisphaerales bacterium]|nr:glycosyltransferase [Phycisphaerales bacterium]